MASAVETALLNNLRTNYSGLYYEAHISVILQTLRKFLIVFITMLYLNTTYV